MVVCCGVDVGTIGDLRECEDPSDERVLYILTKWWNQWEENEMQQTLLGVSVLDPQVGL